MDSNLKRGRGIKISPADKKAMVESIVQRKLEGVSFSSISRELECNFETVRRYWDEYVSAQGDVDCSQLLRERRMMCDRLLDKTLRLFYAGAVSIKDVEAAINMSDRYCGLSQHLSTLVVSNLPPLLEIVVRNVQVDLPPTND